MGPPPPVKRAEKPKVSAKNFHLGPSVGSKDSLIVTAAQVVENRSPFSTPPSSDGSPSRESFPSTVSRLHPISTDASSRSQSPMLFEPPPVHYSVIARRRDQDIHGPDRNVSPQVTGDLREQRPALPIRPLTTSSPSSSRASMDSHRPKILGTPIDTIRSSKNLGPLVRSAEDGPSLHTPPKRISSTPIAQPQPQTRTHGRSMTIDQMSKRAPVNFQYASKHSDPSMDYTTPVTISRPHPALGAQDPSSLSQYPDPTHSNRRPPVLKQGPRDISTKYDTRLFDVCGEYVCTSGFFTRVWSLRDGEQLMNLAHGETIKMMSLAFKPASNPEDEGTRLWLGNNVGDLLEVDIASQSIVATKPSAHTRREIIKIYRHLNELWTLDDAGTLHLWAPDATGSPSLGNPDQSFRVPKGHTFSMVVGSALWLATGKEIRVFAPTRDGRIPFQVLQKPLSQEGVGEVTAGTMISNQPDRVYFGHNDGKVSIYSRHDYACLGTVNVSMYKINSLSGIGDSIWAAYNTGMIYIYDTTRAPWAVIKDWRAHDNPVINVLADRSSFWKMDRQQVLSLGADNILRVWDGLLEDDWFGRLPPFPVSSYVI